MHPHELQATVEIEMQGDGLAGLQVMLAGRDVDDCRLFAIWMNDV
jgi:hypothetical protein